MTGSCSIADELAEPASLQDVLATLRELRQELAAPSNDWENVTLERYLESMEAWLQAVRERVEESGPSLRLFIMMLEAARFYE